MNQHMVGINRVVDFMTLKNKRSKFTARVSNHVMTRENGISSIILHLNCKLTKKILKYVPIFCIKSFKNEKLQQKM